MLDQQLFFIVLFFHSFKTSKPGTASVPALLEPLVRGVLMKHDSGSGDPRGHGSSKGIFQQ